jgi:hypothetical protein
MSPSAGELHGEGANNFSGDAFKDEEVIDRL